VTGIAGFIGSHLAESLARNGWSVRGADAFTDTYARRQTTVPSGSVLNVANGEPVVVGDLIAMLAENLGVEPRIERRAQRVGDTPCTEGCADAAWNVLRWEPRTDVRTGLRRQAEWHLRRRRGLMAAPPDARTGAGVGVGSDELLQSLP
jgi:nucleoside-diphosphate-sugar epimerase